MIKFIVQPISLKSNNLCINCVDENRVSFVKERALIWLRYYLDFSALKTKVGDSKSDKITT